MAGSQIPKDFRRVIIAAAVGNVIVPGRRVWRRHHVRRRACI
jgi:hypothetical protein